MAKAGSEPGGLAPLPMSPRSRHAAFGGDQTIFDHADLVEEFIGKIKKTEGKSCFFPHGLRPWGSGDV